MTPRWRRRGAAGIAASTVLTLTVVGCGSTRGATTTPPSAPPTTAVVGNPGAAATGIVFQCQRILCSINPDGSGLRQLAVPPTGAQTTSGGPAEVLADCTISPRGDRLACAEATDEGGNGHTYEDFHLLEGPVGGVLRSIWMPPPGSFELTGRNVVLDSPLAWNPAGTELAIISSYTADAEALWIMGADGSHPHPVPSADGEPFDPPEAFSLAWSPEGASIALGLSNSVVTVPVSGGSVTQLVGPTQVPGARDPVSLGYGSLSWSPDGGTILATLAQGPDPLPGVQFDVTIQAISVHDGADRRIDVSPYEPTGVAWSPDGTHMVVSVDPTIGATSADEATVRAEGKAPSPLLVANADGSDPTPVSSSSLDPSDILKGWVQP